MQVVATNPNIPKLKNLLQEILQEMRESANWQTINGKYQLFYKLIQSGNLAKDILDLGAPNHPREPTQFINENILNDLNKIRDQLAHYSYAMTTKEKNQFVINMQAYLKKYQDLQTAKATDDNFNPFTELNVANIRVDGYLSNPSLNPLTEDKQLGILIQWLKFIAKYPPNDNNLHTLSMVWIDIGNLLKKCVNDTPRYNNVRDASDILKEHRNDLAHDYNIYFNSHDLVLRLSQNQKHLKTSNLITEFENILEKVKSAQAAKASTPSSYTKMLQQLPPVAASATDQAAIAASASNASQSPTTTAPTPQAKKRSLAQFKLPVPEEEKTSGEQKVISRIVSASTSPEQGSANLEESSPPSSDNENKEPQAKRSKM